MRYACPVGWSFPQGVSVALEAATYAELKQMPWKKCAYAGDVTALTCVSDDVVIAGELSR